MVYENLLLEKEGHIATITLNQPEKLNAFNEQMKRSMRLAARDIAEDDAIRVLIITGTGRGFCSGTDLTRTKGERPRYERQLITGPSFGTDLIFKLDKPVIAAINGVCAGMGFSLALSCDIRIASEKASFLSAFILRGMVPDCGLTYLLPRTVGVSKALQLMFTGDTIDATEAERLGIVSQVVPPDKLMQVSRELAARIAKQPPLAIELTKRVVHGSLVDDLERHYFYETYGQRICHASEDEAAAILAFKEKRPRPEFKGK
jgi:2-(1,2-epoxy-1,2-dihydrophenyl)acetyl-CoA isomerase